MPDIMERSSAARHDALPFDRCGRRFGWLGKSTGRCWTRSSPSDRALDGEAPIVVELMTPGGNADGRPNRAPAQALPGLFTAGTLFLGMTIVYSAGITILSSFRPRNGYLGKGTALLTHERKLDIHI